MLEDLTRHWPVGPASFYLFSLIAGVAVVVVVAFVVVAVVVLRCRNSAAAASMPRLHCSASLLGLQP